MESENEIIPAELGLGVALRECQRPSLLLPQPWPPILGAGQELLGQESCPTTGAWSCACVFYLWNPKSLEWVKKWVYSMWDSTWRQELRWDLGTSTCLSCLTGCSPPCCWHKHTATTWPGRQKTDPSKEHYSSNAKVVFLDPVSRQSSSLGFLEIWDGSVDGDLGILAKSCFHCRDGVPKVPLCGMYAQKKQSCLFHTPWIC